MIEITSFKLSFLKSIVEVVAEKYEKNPHSVSEVRAKQN